MRKLGTLVLLLTAGTAQAASVKKVNAAKGTVAIELEEDETVEKDTTICFFGEDGKKIDCGTVSKSQKTLALVKVESKSSLKKIKEGMAAKIGDADAAKKKDDGDDEDQPKKKKKKDLKKKKKKKGDEDEDSGDDSASAKKKAPPFRLWATYAPALLTPAKYNKLGYAAPTTAAPATLWASDKKVTQALVAFNLEVGIPVSTFSINPGLRYRKYTPSLVDADYVTQHENPYVRVEQQGTAIGLWADFQFLRVPIGKGASSFWAASGLDVDQSTVTLTATKKDDTGQTAEGSVAKATSTDTVISLRLGAGIDLIVAKPFGLFFGTTILIPVTETGKSFSGSLSDGESRGEANPGADLKAALGHGKNSLGAEVSLGLAFAF